MIRTRHVLATAVVVAAGLTPAGGTAAAQTSPPPPPSGADYGVHIEDHTPGQPGTPSGAGGTGSGSGGGSAGPPPACTWVRWGMGLVGNGDDEVALYVTEVTGNGDVLYLEGCNGVATGRLRWVYENDPPPAPPPPDPATLATDISVDLIGRLPDPVVGSDPGPGVSSILNSPVFVRVENWTGVVTDSQCDPSGALCVTVTATPSLRWTPGEPGAVDVACAGAGSSYDPAGPPPEDQARGACAHTYTRRTGVAGRPAAWPGVVTVTWDLAWEGGGRTGGLPAVTKTAAAPRSVAEVQAVVVDSG
jgi:hypothetical protein